jgi:hypothetical protein
MQVDTTFIENEQYMHEYILTGKRKMGQPRKSWRDLHPQRWNKLGMACTLLLLMIVAYPNMSTG